MMKLEAVHAGLQEHLRRLLVTAGDLSQVKFNVLGFDQATCLIKGTGPNAVMIATQMPQLASVGNAGGFDALNEEFAQLGVRLSDSHFTFEVSRDQLPPVDSPDREAAADALAREVSRGYSVFMSGPFRRGFHLCLNETAGAGTEVDFREDAKLWVIPGDGRVTFVFQIDIKNPIDQPLAKVFVQEFIEAKRQVKNPPLIMFTPNPPDYIQSFPHGKQPVSVGYLCVTVLKDQITRPNEQATWLGGFNQYLSYHLHACKTYLHMRMRKQVGSLLTTLKLAVPPHLDEKVFKKSRAAKSMREETKLVRNF